MKKWIGISLLLWPVFIQAQGPIQGFMPGGGNLDLAFSYAYDSYDTYLFGDEARDQKLITRSVNLFLEYGTSDQFSLLLTVPYLWIDDTNQGLQDGSFYLKFRNMYKQNDKGTFSAITALGMTFPFSNYPTSTETPIGIKATTFNARFNLQYRGNQGWFVFLQSGLDYRLIPNALASLPTLFRVGYGGRWIYVDGWLENFYTFNAGSDDRIQGGSGSSWWRFGATFYVSIVPSFGLVFNYARFLSGRNIGLSDRLGAGFVYKFIRKK